MFQDWPGLHTTDTDCHSWPLDGVLPQTVLPSSHQHMYQTVIHIVQRRINEKKGHFFDLNTNVGLFKVKMSVCQ